MSPKSSPERTTKTMDPGRIKPQRQLSGQVNGSASLAIDGLIILGNNFDVVALDAGAESILAGLSSHEQNGFDGRAHLPSEILSLLTSRSGQDLDETYQGLKIGDREYGCRILSIRAPSDDDIQPVLALYLKREVSVVDAVLQAAAEYHLTDREQEALVGVTMGLTSKELAQRMDISPNTVKAFLRLIMIKMGAPTRAAIVGKLLDQNSRARSGVAQDR